MSQSTATIITSMDARTQPHPKPICLSVEHAEEVIDALQWVIDDWDNMDAEERETHRGYYDTYHSILNQLVVELDLRRYPEPEGDPSY